VPVKAARHESMHPRRQLRKRATGLILILKRAKNTRPGSGHSGIAVSVQPLEMTGHQRVPPAHDRLKIVAALAD
jgi:hypothetical protein